MRSTSALIAALALMLVCGGCSAMGAIAYKTIGPAKVKPEYAPPPHEPMLVLSESYSHSEQLQPAADQFANLLADELKKNKVAPVIEPEKLLALRSDRAAEFAKMKIPDVGRALGAKQILYVDLQECDVNATQGSDMLRGVVSANVRVVDVATGKTKWPLVGASHPMKADTNYMRKEARDTPMAIRNQMLDDLSGAIARLFYEYSPDFEDHGTKE
jgi:hypothetical protein